MKNLIENPVLKLYLPGTYIYENYKLYAAWPCTVSTYTEQIQGEFR